MSWIGEAPYPWEWCLVTAHGALWVHTSVVNLVEGWNWCWQERTNSLVFAFACGRTKAASMCWLVINIGRCKNALWIWMDRVVVNVLMLHCLIVCGSIQVLSISAFYNQVISDFQITCKHCKNEGGDGGASKYWTRKYFWIEWSAYDKADLWRFPEDTGLIHESTLPAIRKLISLNKCMYINCWDAVCVIYNERMNI